MDDRPNSIHRQHSERARALALATRAAQSAGAMNLYFREAIKERRARPKGDLTSLLIAVEEDDQLTEEEIIANCSLLLSAGHETTTNLIGNGLLSLLKHPDQLRHVIEKPDIMQSAVEELLRFDCPVQLAPRAFIAEIRLGAVSIPTGQRVTLMLGAANRDGERFNDPDRLNLNADPTGISHSASTVIFAWARSWPVWKRS